MTKKRKIPDLDTVMDWIRSVAEVTHIFRNGDVSEALAKIKGTKRQIRIHPHRDSFEISDDDFDRWANSVEFTLPMPRSKNQALSMIERACK